METEVDPPIVGIGASAGGVKALQAFFQALPSNTGAAFVVIIHLDPGVPSELGTILSSRTSMQVHQVEGAARLNPDSVYVIAPNCRLRIADHMITALPFDEPRGHRAPIDLFFRSLAEQRLDALSFAVILTGAGADGSVGVKAIKATGGIVLVQDPNDAEYASMPRSAIATETADVVLPLRDLAARLVEMLRNRGHVPSAYLGHGEEDLLKRILSYVRSRTGHDFSQYKRATILRRIGRRIQMTRKESLADYFTFLRENVEETQALFGDFLISVTTFFRDPQAFASLAQNVIPQLFEGKDAGDTIRVWVPACATGEEAYTIAMLLVEEADRRDVRPAIQVFASDLDFGALSLARDGRYPAPIANDLTDDRLHRFFAREGEHYRIRAEVRDIVLFAAHSLLKDPPFSRLDMISCRNLLIYLDRDLQQQACHIFNYALNPGGYLFLGSSESGDQPNGLFRAVDREARIYRSVQAGDRRATLPLLIGQRPGGERSSLSVPQPVFPAGNLTDAVLHRRMLEKIAPPSMLVDEGHHAVHLSENAGRYVQPSGGPVSVDATDMVRPELRFELRSALHRAFERGEATLTVPILVRFEAEHRRVYLQIKPVLQDDDPARYALVLFIEGEAIEYLGDRTELGIDGPPGDAIRQLQDELQLAQTRLRTTREESDAINEELRAANEELQSINEEYRSTSEELETSKEELQSMNEELQTVNAELKLKLESISRAHSDLQNLMAATDVGTLFLDPSLKIKRFTPRLKAIFNVTDHDEGRPITDFTHQLEYERLAEHAQDVLRELTPIENEVQSRDGGWYLVRMRPYRTVDNKIDGVVATFVDIAQRRQAEKALRESEERLRQEMRLVELSRSPIFVWEFDGGIVKWNRGSEELYGYAREEAVGKKKEHLLQTAVPGSSFEALRQRLLERGTWSGTLMHKAKDGRTLTVEANIELAAIEGRRLVLESTRDVTDRKRLEERQQLLMNELTHRVKNTLTVVQSMARQMLRTSPSPTDFVEKFEGRLSALAGAHKLLIESHWGGAEIGALARDQLQAYVTDNASRLRMVGEPVILPPHLATPFGLVLHELATNAAKYGAFSTPIGHVLLNWGFFDRNDSGRLTIVWEEHGGPPVIAPSSHGLGSKLIERGMPSAAVHYEFRSSGVVCAIDIDLGRIQEGMELDGAEI